MSSPQRQSQISEVFSVDRIHPGRHLRLRAGDIQVDESYQRDVTGNRVARMAADWQSTGPIRVSIRTDTERAGEIFVYDGQHRRNAFIERWGEDAEIDCWAEDLPRNEEARRFAHQYRDAIRVAPHYVLRALASTGDSHARGVMALMAKFDLRPTHTINAVTTFSQLFRRDPLLLEVVLGVMREAWGTWGDRFQMPTGPVYAGLFSLYLYHADEINRQRLIDVLSRVPPRSLIFQALSRNPTRTKLDEDHIYQVLIDIYNGRRRDDSPVTKLTAQAIGRSVHKRNPTDPI